MAQACLARLEAVNPRLNAVIARRDAAVRSTEAAAPRGAMRVARPLSPLDGVPLTVKDSLLHRRPCRRPGARRRCAGIVPATTNSPVARARAAGALIIGKTNVPEFALEGYTDNPLFGVTAQSVEPALTPGGSSGGAVAAVAAGIAPLAIGQDGGGSIRRPASHTGLVGLKPSLGAVPREHVLPSLLLDFEVIGPLARTVADARLLFDVMRGPAAVDRSSLAAAQAARSRAARPAAAHPVRRTLRRRAAGSADRSQRRRSGAAARIARPSGRTGALPLDLDFFAEAWPQIGQIGLAQLFERHPDWAAQASPKYLRHGGAGTRAAGRAPVADPRAGAAAAARQRGAVRGHRRDRHAVRRSIAVARGGRLPDRIDGQEVGPRGHAVYTGWVNAAGLPALALPCAPSREGLPIGMQLVGRYGSDDLLLDLGEAYESAHPWADRWPAS